MKKYNTLDMLFPTCARNSKIRRLTVLNTALSIHIQGLSAFESSSAFLLALAYLIHEEILPQDYSRLLLRKMQFQIPYTFPLPSFYYIICYISHNVKHFFQISRKNFLSGKARDRRSFF